MAGRRRGGGGVSVCLILPGHPSVFRPRSLAVFSSGYPQSFAFKSICESQISRAVKRRSLKPEVALSTGSLLLRARRRLVSRSPPDKGTRSTGFMSFSLGVCPRLRSYAPQMNADYDWRYIKPLRNRNSRMYCSQA